MFFEEQFRLAQQQRFVVSSESHPAQGDLFKPLYARLQETLLQQGVIQADETTLKVINEDKAKVTCGTTVQVPTRRVMATSRILCCTTINQVGPDSVWLIIWMVLMAICMQTAQPKGKTGKADMALSIIKTVSDRNKPQR